MYYIGSAQESGFRNGIASQTYFSQISDITQFNSTYILIADTMNHCIRRLDRLAEQVETLVGRCRVPGDMNTNPEVGTIPVSEARLMHPVCIVMERSESVVYYLQYMPVKIIQHNLVSGK